MVLNVLGPRGIEAMRNTIGGVTETQFPLYDGHGNLKALLHRGTGGTYSTSSWRQYDVWGGFLDSGSNLDESAYGHCASLGHPSDPLTGAIYMRARYYEPWTGRFISEDPARDGLNWFGYCGNNPVGHVDFDGNMFVDLIVTALIEDFLKKADGSSKIAAESFTKQKIIDASSYWAGRLIGELLSNEFDELFAMVTSRGVAIGDKAGGIFIDFDGAKHNGKVHVDTWGSVKHQIQSTYKTGNYRLDLFIKGIEDALIP